MYAIHTLPAGGSFRALECAPIDRFPWDKNGFKPKSRAYLWKTESGLCCALESREDAPRAEITQIGGMVCTDSCLECFVTPRPSAALSYYNLEINPKGVFHLGIGEGRHGRRVYDALPEGAVIKPLGVTDGFWGVYAYLPWSFFIKEFGGMPEDTMRGNFYKCGDKTPRPHYGMWKAYDLPAPDFHRPELFDTLQFQ